MSSLGTQLSKFIALEISTSNESQSLSISFFLPISLPKNFIAQTGRGKSKECLPRDCEIRFTRLLVDKFSPSEIRKVSLAALGCLIQRIIKSIKLSILM